MITRGRNIAGSCQNRTSNSLVAGPHSPRAERSGPPSEFEMRTSRLIVLAMLGLLVWLTTRQTSAQRSDSAAPSLQPAEPNALAAAARFFDYDEAIPLDARIVERTRNEDATREKFVLRGVRGFLTPGYLEVPTDRQEPAPLVLLLHGWSGSKQSWWQDGGYISGGNLRAALLRVGFAVLALDAPAHGDRIAENDYALVNDLQDDDEATHRNYFTLSDIVVQGARDYRRALDFVATRDDVDSSRIGLIGYSMGGLQAFILSAVEPRICATVACVTPSLAGDSTPIAPKDYAGGIVDRPFLMLMGNADGMCRPQHARELLAMIPGDRSKLKFFEAGHKLPVKYVDDARAWLETHLK